jgi:hypothetical protein
MAGVMQVSRLGAFGRWGNQLFQYCAAKAIARERNAELQVPSTWIGRLVFDIPEPPIQAPFGNTPGCDPLLNDIPTDADLWGYFQNPEYYVLYSREDARAWLKLSPKWEGRRHAGLGGVVAHWRSYAGYEGHYCVVATRSYAVAAEQYRLGDYVTVSDVSPHRGDMMPDEISFLTDFLALLDADVILRGNSTFSIWAAWLGRATRVYSPVVGDLVGGPHLVSFVPGNASPILNFARNCPGELGRIYGEYRLRDET